MSSTRPRSSKLQVIQALRGISALLVVLYHFREPFLDGWPRLSASMSHGEIGVDIFFLISGIVIYVSTQADHARNASTFLVRRLFRVVVPAWVAMVLMASIHPPYLKDLLLGVAFIPLRNEQPPGYGFNFLIVAWTLTYELIFYAIFAFALTTRIGRRHRATVTAIFLLSMVAIVQWLTGRMTIDAYQVGVFPSSKYFPMQIFSLLGNPLFLEFVLGLVLAALYQRRVFHRLGRWRPWFGLIVLALAALTLRFQYQDGDGLTRGGLLALWIVTGALTVQSYFDAMDGQALSVASRLPEALGNISYSLYLIHPIIKSLVLTTSLKTVLLGTMGSFASFFVILLATLGLSQLFYRLVEVPAQLRGKAMAEALSARGTKA